MLYLFNSRYIADYIADYLNNNNTRPAMIMGYKGNNQPTCVLRNTTCKRFTV